MNRLLLSIVAIWVFISFHSCTDTLSVDDNPATYETEEPKAVTVFNMEDLPDVYFYVSSKDWNILLNKYDDDSNVKHGNTSRKKPEGKSGQMHVYGGNKYNHCHYMVNLRKYVKDDMHELGGKKNKLQVVS